MAVPKSEDEDELVEGVVETAEATEVTPVVETVESETNN
jgi:EAL domain-containing protein (putative c-di-GMP-specific phosphodiesterase class I)